MSELRWALLACGTVFVVILAWWEYRRPRHAPRDKAATGHAARQEPSFGGATDAVGRDHGSAEFEIPDMRTSELGREPPLVVVDEAMLTGGALDLSAATEVAIDAPGSGTGSPAQAAAAPERQAEAESELKLNWPPAQQQRIVWLRVVPQPPGRFPGRALRLALNACGMRHGPQQIFHLAQDDGQVIVSAANLTRPGSFDPATMDTLHFHGLNLFAVLPGPLPPEKAVDALVAIARDLAGRLAGLVQDEVGRPIDAARLLAIRQSVTAESAADEADA